MYIIAKNFRVEQAHLNSFLERLQGDSPILTFDGFEKREIMSTKTIDGVVTVRMVIYFTDKKAYYRWEGSKEHIAMHQQKHEKPVGLVGVSSEKYTMHQTIGFHDQTNIKS